MQLFDQGKPPLGVVFDCDMGSTIGDPLALALLYGLESKNEARVISVSVCNSNVNAAAYVDALSDEDAAKLRQKIVSALEQRYVLRR